MQMHFYTTYTLATAPRNIVDEIEHHKCEELIVGTFYNAGGQFDGITISADDDYTDAKAWATFFEHIDQMEKPWTNADFYIYRGDTILYVEFTN